MIAAESREPKIVCNAFAFKERRCGTLTVKIQPLVIICGLEALSASISTAVICPAPVIDEIFGLAVIPLALKANAATLFSPGI